MNPYHYSEVTPHSHPGSRHLYPSLCSRILASSPGFCTSMVIRMRSPECYLWQMCKTGVNGGWKEKLTAIISGERKLLSLSLKGEAPLPRLPQTDIYIYIQSILKLSLDPQASTSGYSLFLELWLKDCTKTVQEFDYTFLLVLSVRVTFRTIHSDPIHITPCP